MALKEIIEELLKGGIVIEMNYDKELETIKYDLNTGMKSHCHLYEKDDQIMADMRYGKSIVIEDYDEVVSEVLGCLHGRSYLSCSWNDLLIKEGYDMDKIIKACIF